jgi:TetR/AcrR family transcriptional regulator of autoinduction and epiphytic fitness
VQALVHCALVTTANVADGRSARKNATRDAIADALLDLLEEGQLRPTAKEIAARAGISVRSVYVHFDDLEKLFCTAAWRQLERIGPLLTPTPDDGDLQTRASAFVAHRAELFAHFGAVRRAAELQAPFSPTLQRIISITHVHSRSEIERLFAKELAALEPNNRERVIAVIDTLTSGGMWDGLHTHHNLSGAETERALVDTIVARLEAPA